MLRRFEESFTTWTEVEVNAMQRFAGFAVLVVGIVLIVWGANASQSVSSDISRFFTGAATNKAIYMIVGGDGRADRRSVNGVHPSRSASVRSSFRTKEL